MRDYQIIVEPIDYVALLDMQIKKEINEHAKATVTMRIRESDKDQYLSELQNGMWMGIKAVGEKGEIKVLFRGIVTDFQVKVNLHEIILIMEAADSTFLLDIKEHFRTFQNASMSLTEICDIINQNYADISMADYRGNNSGIGHVSIQHRETDWEFMKRLASETYGYITPEPWKKDIGYLLGLPKGREYKNEAGKIKYISDMGSYKAKAAKLVQMGGLELVCENRELHELGDWLMQDGKKYYLYKSVCMYKGGECMNIYHFRTKDNLFIQPVSNNKLAGCSFEAVVTSVKRDQVKIDVIGDENASRPERNWFVYGTVYSSPDGTGWYCMPEIGDTVRLYVPETEAGSFVISSVHMETSVSRQNPDYKSFKTKYGKEILFTPDTIIMTNNQGMMIELADESGIYIASDKDITIQADGNLTVASQSDALLIAAQDCVQVKQGGTTMTLKDDISFTGGEFRIQ